VGTEYEKVGIYRDTGQAIPYFGKRGVDFILRELIERFGWSPTEESGRVIALERGGATITLEPGAQLELSGEQCANVHCARRELTTHVREIVSVGDELGIAFLGLGIQPISRIEEIEWVPKPRYQVMGPYMTRVGTMGQRMMKQTATVQVNLDYSDERDAMRKFRVGMAIAPLLNAMFANSPITDGKLNGFMSYRGHIWTDTDAARCGLLPFAFRDDAGFIDYVRWALDVPMYFILRRGEYRTNVTGVPFRRFLEQGADGERATVDDWSLHLTTLFPEVRLKGYIELRATDSQSPERMLALPALAKGIFYMPHCLNAAFDMIRRWTYEDTVALYRDVHRQALRARFRGIEVLEYARELHAIAEEGLQRQHALDDAGNDERVYLERTREELAVGRSPARDLAAKWEGEWDRRPERLVEATAYRVGTA
jgi:glutamate--cysteine ligase